MKRDIKGKKKLAKPKNSNFVTRRDKIDTFLRSVSF